MNSNPLKCLVAIVCLLAVSSISAQKDWKLVYENDETGKAVHGTIEDLVSHIRDGRPIRIYYRMGGSKPGDRFVEHTTDAKFFTIMNSNGKPLVMAQIDPIVGQTPSFEEGTLLLKENLEWSLIASTTGENDQMTRNVITGEVVNHSTRKWGTKWFVFH